MLTMDDIYDVAELTDCFSLKELQDMLKKAQMDNLYYHATDCSNSWKSETKMRNAVIGFIANLNFAIRRIAGSA